MPLHKKNTNKKTITNNKKVNMGRVHKSSRWAKVLIMKPDN